MFLCFRNSIFLNTINVNEFQISINLCFRLLLHGYFHNFDSPNLTGFSVSRCTKRRNTSKNYIFLLFLEKPYVFKFAYDYTVCTYFYI